MSEHDDEGPEDPQINSLIAVDNAIVALENCDSASASNKLHDLACALLTHFGQQPSTASETVQELFDKSLSRSEQRFIAICLLRALAVLPSIIQDNQDIRVRAIALFDTTLEHDVYKQLHLTPKQQTYEKLPVLRECARAAEDALCDVLPRLTSLEHLEELRQNLMRVLGQPLVKAVIQPFLPASLKSKNTSRLREVFEAIDSYQGAPTAQIAERYVQAINAVDDLITEFSEFPTSYMQQYVVPMVIQIRDTLKANFARSNFAQPACIEVRSLPKRYPLFEPDHEMSLGFAVQNVGPGPALDTVFKVNTSVTLELMKDEQALGELEPGTVICNVPARVKSPADSELVDIEVEWRNVDGSVGTHSVVCEFVSQRSDIDWNVIESSVSPYSLEPVETFTELVGRREIINQLMNLAHDRSVGSAYVFGQKRVGKTSIAKALKTRLEDAGRVTPIYLEGGEYRRPGAEATIGQLGRKLCQRIQKLDSRLQVLTIPDFGDALGPLSDFLESANELVPGLRVVFILDEFDELPIDVYRRGPLGDAFFLTLRTISGQPPFGFVLVGGEKMDSVMSCQGEQLNKFEQVRVDYFDKTHHWADYCELVTRPTKEWLEFDDEAILTLYERTAGNPFYTVHVCRTLFEMMRDRRDGHATRREIDEAVALLPQKLASNSFQHFWEDGIFEATGDREEEISIRRRRILLALAYALRSTALASKDNIASQTPAQPCLEMLDLELQRFVQRRVLVDRSGAYDCKIPIFRNWLVERGVDEILTTFSDLDNIMLRKQKEEVSYVRPAEVCDLTDSWELYQGKRITTDHVRTWLEQFGDYINQRLMFTILQKVRFYSQEEVRQNLREAHTSVRRQLSDRPSLRSGRQRNTGEILISHLGPLGKSGGGTYARLYAKVNSIYVNNVVERRRLVDLVAAREETQAIVFVDDFIGTGESAQSYLGELAAESGEALRNADVKLFYIAITGFQDSVAAIRNAAVGWGLDVEVIVCDPLDASDKCFGELSHVFQTETERNGAHKIAYEYGVRCVSSNPLGFGNSQALIVFPDDCPNNSLPILWASSENPPFRPLFKRPIARR